MNNIAVFFRNLFRSDFVDWGDVWAINEKDFWASHISNIQVIPKHEFPKFNQYKYKRIGKSTCTITNAVKDALYNYGIPFNKNYVFSAVDYCVREWWYTVWHWWSTPKAMQYVRKRLESLWIKASFVRLRYTDPKVQKYLDKGYMVWVSFNWNHNYILDYAKDGILDWITFGKRTFWHRTSMYWNHRIRDSEYWFKYNDYKLAHYKELVEAWTYNWRVYVWTLPEDLIAPVDDIKRLVKFESQVNEAIKLNSEMREKSNDVNFKNLLHNTNTELRKKLKDIKMELKKHNK